MDTTQKLKKEERSLEKNTTVSKERSVANDIRESIETSLNHKIRILQKDLKKKRVEYSIRRQQYTDQLEKLSEKKEQESIRYLNYELLNDPRYEFDAAEIENIRKRNSVIQDEFNKCITIVGDDNIKSIVKVIKSNYDEQFRELLGNAERSIKTIAKIKTSFEDPINEMIKRINTLEFEFAAETKKHQVEIDEQKQVIDRLKDQVSQLKLKTKDNKNEKSKGELRLAKELKATLKENKQMKEVIQDFKDEVDYCKQRENKLMYFLYVMKEKGLPVGEIFESEIKDIPTKRFSKYFDDDSREEKHKASKRKYASLTERIFPPDKEQILSDTTSIMPITFEPAVKQKKHSIVPNLMLDNLPPRHLHYFSEDSQRSGFDLSFEQKKANDNATLAQKYNLWSFGERMKQAKIKGELQPEKKLDSHILKLGHKIFENERKLS